MKYIFQHLVLTVWVNTAIRSGAILGMVLLAPGEMVRAMARTTVVERAGDPSPTNPENPFAGKVFVTAAYMDSYFANFRFLAFNTDDRVTEGKESLRREDLSGLGDRYEKQQAYQVDARKKILTVGDAGYTYEFKNSKTVELRQALGTVTYYEVPSRPEVFFRGEDFLHKGGFADPDAKGPLMDMRLGMLNRYIEAAKAEREPPPPTPQPVRSASAPAQPASLLNPIAGLYRGILRNEAEGTSRPFELRIGALGEASGAPPTAVIKGSIRFVEDGKGDDRLEGVVTYGAETTFDLTSADSSGSMKFDGRLDGNELSGNWRAHDFTGSDERRGSFAAKRGQ
jgi:hypothetical protein